MKKFKLHTETIQELSALSWHLPPPAGQSPNLRCWLCSLPIRALSNKYNNSLSFFLSEQRLYVSAVADFGLNYIQKSHTVWLWPLTIFSQSLLSDLCPLCQLNITWLANWGRRAQGRLSSCRWGEEWRLVVFCVDTGQRLEAGFLTQTAAFPLAGPLQLVHSPQGVFCVGPQVSSAAVLGHQVVFFSPSVLATLSYRRSQT